MPSSYVYMLECEKDRLYIGYCTDLERRMKQHFSGKGGAKFTRAFKPLKVAALWQCRSGKSHAMRIEAFLKGLSRNEKLEIVANPQVLMESLIQSDRFEPEEVEGMESLAIDEINDKIKFF